ncbi:hypothetical protein BGZ80_000313 [Entomortierella chlamydospora]|uniref:Uncharacterized protein n=1 Tax=Entomortierella chlamydospora TaxID=101097 RepID=A0A9P6SYT5_9FUNG|nr:hypothetical protein BGZ80_000313 [Entomortierella chlamydospora]
MENEIATTTSTPAFSSPESLSYSGMTSVSHVQKLSYESGREMTEARNLFNGDNSDKRQHIQHYLLHYGADQPTLPNKDNSIISSSTALPRYDIQSRSNLQRGPPGGGYAFKRSMKRKATWEDEEMMMDSLDAVDPGSVSAPLSQQSIQTASAQDRRMSQVTEIQDQEMNCDRYDCEPMTATPEDCSSGQMSVDIGTPSSVDQQDFERSDSNNHNEGDSGMMGPIWSAKRTKPRLELVAIPGSAFAEMEARRREAGQIELDIFQQCFYNAAATSR